MKKNILILAVATLLVSGCNKIDEFTMPEEGVMQITALHPSATRATATDFEEGDKIGIYVTDYTGDVAAPLQISGNWANNVEATYNGSVWNLAKKIFWSDNKMDVYGYYPYMTPVSIDEHPFAVALDQSIEGANGELGGYEASDFLWAKATGVTKDDENVELEFKHRCSKLIIKLVKGADYKGDFPSASEFYIHNVVPTATIDFTTGAVVKDVFGEPTTIKAHKVDDGTFEAIIVPQRMTSRLPFLELVARDISYLVEDKFTFVAGKCHTIQLTINSSPDQVEIQIGGEVEGGEW